MHQLALDSVVEETVKALQVGNIDLAEQLIWPALDQRPQNGALWFYAGSILAAKGQYAVALQCYLKSLELEPHPAIWGNAGVCLRYMQDIAGCRRMFERGLEHAPGDSHMMANLCGSYVNEGDPLPGIAIGEQVKDHPESGPSVRFNLALLHLEAGHYAEGFELYATGHHTHRELRTYDPDPPPLTPELHAQLRGQGKRLLVYGEQGLGDELMFATMLLDAREDYEIIFDSHPRLEWLHRNSRWFNHPARYRATIYPTRKTNEKGWSETCDAKVPIGNLARFYRDAASKFRWHGQEYHAPADLVTEYRAHLEKLAAGRKIIGLATRGGTMSTARLYRVMPLSMIEKLFEDDSCMYVSLDYEDMSQLAEIAAAKFGPNKFVWNPSVVWHWDYHHTAALVAATDALVTVPQTVAHISAAMEHPTYVMQNSRPDWRMGLTGESWYWYATQNTRLLRQVGDSWQPALTRLSELLEARPYTSPLHMHERQLLEPLTLAGASMCELGSKWNSDGLYKDFFESRGVTHVSIDLNGEGRSLVYDLQKPLDIAAIGGPFDIVTNFGTTEHVDEQEQCWRNVHDLIKEGGYLISTTPLDWPGHGRWYPSLAWYQDFCAVNDYELEDEFVIRDRKHRHMQCIRARKRSNTPFTMPATPIDEQATGKTGGYIIDENNAIRRVG